MQYKQDNDLNETFRCSSVFRFCCCSLNGCISRGLRVDKTADPVSLKNSNDNREETNLEQIVDNIEVGQTAISKDPIHLPLPVLAPKYIGKKSLVLDVDRTILYRSSKKVEVPNITLTVSIYSQTREQTVTIYVSIRPGLNEFLEAISPYYEIILFTKSTKELANPIIDKIDSKGHVSHRLFIDSCITDENGNIIKDISLLGRDLKQVIIVDDNHNVFQRQKLNAIECYPFFGNSEWDTELEQIKNILLEVKDADDVRDHLSRCRERFSPIL